MSNKIALYGVWPISRLTKTIPAFLRNEITRIVMFFHLRRITIIGSFLICHSINVQNTRFKMFHNPLTVLTTE